MKMITFRAPQKRKEPTERTEAPSSRLLFLEASYGIENRSIF